MDRRTALKNLSIGLGYTVASPTIFNMLSSCTAEASGWTPLFLSVDEKHMVTHLTDIILPKTNTPGALDVNVPQFLDLMYADIEKKQNQDIFKKGALIFGEAFKTKFDIEVVEGNKAQYETLLGSYFKISETTEQALLKLQRQPLESISKTDMGNYLLYNFLLSVRRYTLFGYYTSEKVGETILNYDPIPGEQKGCIPLEDVPNSNAWSL
ncbi:gluconate 2-dehydrogenase subunit 3 family protein [Algibacter marinivivus]|nr:gluconate 2-dehydrogenase subunit 3 family protein [Algibacter marinivivus]